MQQSVFFLLCAASLLAVEMDQVIQELPTPTELSEIQEKVLIYYLDHLGPDSPEQNYRIASLYIQTGELDKAKEVLQKDPDFFQAVAQLGFIYLWERNWRESDRYFSKAWGLKACSSDVAVGRLLLSMGSGKNGKKVIQEVERCDFKKGDTLLYLGLLQTRLHFWDQAEITFQKCLKISSNDRDAQFALGSLYILEKRYEEAAEIYNRYPDEVEAQLGLARIAAANKNWPLAESLYRKALEKSPANLEAIEGLAQTLSAQLKYREAKQEYALLLSERPLKPSKIPSLPPWQNQNLWIQSMEVKSHTNCALKTELDYTDAKEDDPTLGVPTVKDYYFTEKITFLVPILNRWRLEAEQLYYHQRENQILNQTVNYSAFINGASLYSRLFFIKDWRWDVSLKGVEATGFQTRVTYPFRKKTLFEPGTLLIYQGDWNQLVLDAHVEDQIIKNFSGVFSELLQIDVYQGEYGLHPPVYLRPNLEIGAGRNDYHDSIHNWKQYQKVKGELDLGTDRLRAGYLLEHGKFKELTANYFSYKKQIQQTLSVRYSQPIHRSAEIQLLWDHIWQSNHQVILPVGSLLFTGNRLYLIGNKFTGLLKYRFQDRVEFELRGHYYTLTLPYRDWNLSGSLYWQF